MFARGNKIISALRFCLSHNVDMKRNAHSFAAPPSPNLLNIRRIVEQKLQPIHFEVQNDYHFGNYVYDMHFKGYLCSPLFEGKTYREINEMVDEVLNEVGMKGQCRFHCQPPSRWLKMKKLYRHRLSLEK